MRMPAVMLTVGVVFLLLSSSAGLEGEQRQAGASATLQCWLSAAGHRMLMASQLACAASAALTLPPSTPALQCTSGQGITVGDFGALFQPSQRPRDTRRSILPAVAILDSGLDPALTAPGRLRGSGPPSLQVPVLRDWVPPAAGGQQGMRDPLGHGSAVALLLASQQPDTPGVVPGCPLHVHRVFSPSGQTKTAWITQALRDEGGAAPLVLLSQGGPDRRDHALYTALLATAGLVIAAAGNDGPVADTVLDPALQSRVLAVAASALAPAALALMRRPPFPSSAQAWVAWQLTEAAHDTCFAAGAPPDRPTRPTLLDVCQLLAARGREGRPPCAKLWVAEPPVSDPARSSLGIVPDFSARGTASPRWNGRGWTWPLPKPDVAAPGLHLCVGGGRRRMSGTSMAAPVVAGLAAETLATLCEQEVRAAGAWRHHTAVALDALPEPAARAVRRWAGQCGGGPCPWASGPATVQECLRGGHKWVNAVRFSLLRAAILPDLRMAVPMVPGSPSVHAVGTVATVSFTEPLLSIGAGILPGLHPAEPLPLNYTLTLQPPRLDLMECPYMWPWCAQPLYPGGPSANVAVQVGATAVSAPLSRSVQVIHTDRCLKVDIACTAAPCGAPLSDALLVTMSVPPNAAACPSKASAQVKVCDLHSAANMWDTVLQASLGTEFVHCNAGLCMRLCAVLPIQAALQEVPPAQRRVGWLLSQQRTYPESGYVMHNAFDMGREAMEWQADGPHGSKSALFRALLRAGFAVEPYLEPWNTVRASSPLPPPATVLLVDPEAPVSALEAEALRHDVEAGMGLIVVGEHFDGAGMKAALDPTQPAAFPFAFNDSASSTQWRASFAGAHVPSLNALLRPWGVALHTDSVAHAAVSWRSLVLPLEQEGRSGFSFGVSLCSRGKLLGSSVITSLPNSSYPNATTLQSWSATRTPEAPNRNEAGAFETSPPLNTAAALRVGPSRRGRVVVLADSTCIDDGVLQPAGGALQESWHIELHVHELLHNTQASRHSLVGGEEVLAETLRGSVAPPGQLSAMLAALSPAAADLEATAVGGWRPSLGVLELAAAAQWVGPPNGTWHAAVDHDGVVDGPSHGYCLHVMLRWTMWAAGLLPDDTLLGIQST